MAAASGALHGMFAADWKASHSPQSMADSGLGCLGGLIRDDCEADRFGPRGVAGAKVVGCFLGCCMLAGDLVLIRLPSVPIAAEAASLRGLFSFAVACCFEGDFCGAAAAPAEVVLGEAWSFAGGCLAGGAFSAISFMSVESSPVTVSKVLVTAEV